MVAIDLNEVLSAAVADVQSVPLRTIKAARVLAVDNEWVKAQSAADQQVAIEKARLVYNRAQEWRRHCTDEDTLRRNSHLRALALVVLKDWGSSTLDSEIAVMSKHWGRTALQFVLCAELCAEDEEADIEQAQLCFRQAFALLQRASAPGQVEVLEASCMLKGWQAQLDWLKGDVQSVIQRLEDAHAALEQHGGSALLPTARRYLSEHCAYALASSGFQKCAGIDGEGGGAGHAIDRRSLMRMLDLTIALLGDDLGDAQALRDRALRLKAWLALLEEDFDLAAQALDQHTCYELRRGGHTASEARAEAEAVVEAERDVGAGEAGYHLLTFTLLFKTNRKAEACSQVLDWVSTTPFDMSRDALQVLQENDCSKSAVDACSRLLERFASSQEEYSELVEVKHRLLEGEEGAPSGTDARSPAAETPQDSAAAAAYLETVIDAHSNGQRKLTSATLQTLGRRLFRAGCRSFATGDLHHGIERFEGASRFLELAEENSDQLNVQAWLAYCYMIQDRPDKAKARAVAALRVAARVQPNAGDVASLMSDAAGLEEGDEGVAGMRPVTLATLMLIKAHLKLGDATEANDAIARLLEQKPMDDKLLAAVCEEISTMGPTYHHAVEAILEHFVRKLDAAPSVPNGNAEQSPQPPALATPSKNKLVASVRSLMLHRILRKGKGVTAEELSTKLLADVKLVAARLALLGPDAICDSPADLEWLADKAFDLGIECITASEAGAATDIASVGVSEDERLASVDDDALRRCTEFVSASCELRERLPG